MLNIMHTLTDMDVLQGSVWKGDTAWKLSTVKPILATSKCGRAEGTNLIWISTRYNPASKNPTCPSRITHPVDKVRAAHSSNLANVVHENQVSLGGAVHLAHFNVSEAIQELPPDVLPQPIPYANPHLVNFIHLCLMEKEGRDGIKLCSIYPTTDHFPITLNYKCLKFKKCYMFYTQ